jgi:flavin-dependent dehydrogenase
MEILEVDTLVCGGGMSGMACAAFAADAGAKTLVVEKQAQIGGSSALSAGMLYVQPLEILVNLCH